MPTIEFPFPKWRVSPRHIDGREVRLPENPECKITFDIVVHPKWKPREIADDTPMYLRVDHQLVDANGAVLIFRSYVPASFFWEQLAGGLAFLDLGELLSFELDLKKAPREIVVAQGLRDNHYLRHHHAYRCKLPGDNGHPSIVGGYLHHAGWTVKLSWLENTGAFLVTFSQLPGAITVMAMMPDGESWHQIEVPSGPLFFCLAVDSLTWRTFEEPDMADTYPSFKRALAAVILADIPAS